MKNVNVELSLTGGVTKIDVKELLVLIPIT